MIECKHIRDSWKDIDEVLDVIYDQWGQFFRKSKSRRKEIIKDAIDENKKFPQMYILKDDNTLIGSFSFKERELAGDEFKGSPWVSCLIIKKEFRGKGYGEILLQYLDKISQENYKQVYLLTEHIGLYEKIGFQYIKEIDHNGQINRLYVKNYNN